MIVDKNIFKPIKTLGFIFLVSGFIFIFYNVVNWNEFIFGVGERIFMMTIATWFMLTGIGILLKKPWGFYLLKSVLYLLYIGWPLGTMLAKWILKYIKDNEIKLYFYNKVIEI